MVTCQTIALAGAVVVGVVMSIIGSSGLLFLPKMTQKKIAEALTLKNGSESAERFIKSPVASYMKIYLFKVTNKGLANQGATPVLMEMGPYVFRQEKEKTILNWNEEAGTVTYKESTLYYFEPELSKGTLQDEINHVNTVAISLRYNKAIASSFPGPKFAEYLRSLDAQYIVTHTVNELLFGGHLITEYLPEHMGFLCKMAPPLCTFGYYYGKNGTSHIPLKQSTVKTGAHDISTIGQFVSYDKSKDLPFWYGEECNALRGTDGKQFSPWLDRSQRLHVFSPDVCRSILLEYEQDVVVEDIDTYRYVVPQAAFADPNKNPDNMCYCKREAGENTCQIKAGVFSISSCQQDKPVAISAPHFYLGEEEYVDNFVGLRPEKEKHGTYLDIEQFTGTVISAAKRIQVNIIVEPSDTLKMLQHVDKTIFFPALWAEESGQIDPKSAEAFRKKVTSPYKTAKGGMIALLIIGLLVALVFGAIGLMLFKKNRWQPVSTNETDTKEIPKDTAI